MDLLVPLALVAALAGCAVLLVLTRRDCAAARDACARATSRADLAERDAGHQAERAVEAARRREALDAEFRKAEDERRDLARSEARLAESVDGLGRKLEDARAERAAIQARLDETARDVTRLTADNERLQATLEAQRAAHEGEVALIKGLREEMTDRFQALADATLERHGARFGEANQREIKALIEPVREQVQRFQGELSRAHADAGTERKLLQAEIERLSTQANAVSREATALTEALRGDKQRQGAWGEMLLERILEESGLREGLNYERQASVRSDEGARLRPDVVVRLPRGRNGEDKRLVIDSKVSLNAYHDAVACDEPAEAEPHLAAHVAALRRHVDALASKDYAAAVGGSVDYVLMFVPTESALGAAWRHEADLASYAIERRVALVTPTTLLTVLRTVHHVWAVEDRNRNAEEIARRAGLLYDKLALFTEVLDEVGQHLDRARQAHGTALDRLSRGNGNALGQVEKLRRLGAKASKTMAIPFDPHDDDGGEDGDDAPPAIEAAE